MEPNSVVFTVENRLDVHELVARYGHVLDENQFDRAHELFTDDAVFDGTAAGGATIQGWRAIAEHWSDPQTRHPLAHHATNVVLEPNPDGSITVVFKGLGVGYRGRVGTLVYRGSAVRTTSGWRFGSLAARLLTSRVVEP
jgi:SnoaL-like domain